MNYETLVLSGGGFKGIAQLGCLHYLYSSNQLDYITDYIGTSIGSIICYLLIIGYKPIEIFEYISKTDITPEINNILSLCLYNIKNIKEIINIIIKNGIVNYDKINNILRQMTLDKLYFIPTLKELYFMFDKNLTCISYRFKKNEIPTSVCNISYSNFPNLSCLDALRMSCNIPIIFGEFIYEEYTYMDGGLIDNFSINMNNKKYIGISLLGDSMLESDNIFVYLVGIIQLPMYVREKSKLKNNSNIIRLNVNEISYNASYEDKLKLFNEGYNYLLKRKLKID